MIYFMFFFYYLYSAKLSELEVIVPNEDAVNCDLKLQLLNGNLVYLCRRLTVPLEDVSIVECLGIGKNIYK